MPRRRRLRRPGALTEVPPLRIISQIAALQGVYYASALTLTLFTALAAGTRFGTELVFGWESVRGDTTQGWLLAFCLVLTGGLCLGGAIVVLVTRSKLVPDFALTTHAVHLLVCTFYTGLIPRNAMWWGSMGLSSALSICLGVWGCRYRELQPISFGGRRDVDGGEEGRQGPGTDGRGEYEMTRMGEDPRTK